MQYEKFRSASSPGFLFFVFVLLCFVLFCFVFVSKIQLINKASGTRCSSESVLSHREKESKQLIFLCSKTLKWNFSSMPKSLWSQCPSLLIPVCLSVSCPLTLNFSLCELLVYSLFAPLLDLWLSLYSLVYCKQKTLGLKMFALA